MADAASSHAPQPQGATGVLVLADGTVLWGHGFGATGAAVGEVCFNTSMTGYEEIMTDPSYAGQVVTFTFPHIGNVGVNEEDLESHVDGAVGCVVREDVTAPSNFRSQGTFGDWLAAKGKIGLSGIDTRALTRRIRLSGAPNAVIAHEPSGKFDIPALVKRAQDWPGLEGMDLARVVSREEIENWEGGVWTLGKGYARSPHDKRPHVVAIDYGAKDNIFRNLVKAGAKVTVVPAQTPLDGVLALEPDGVFLSNGPGDPAATGAYAVPVIQGLLERDIPLFGICLGHQMLALAAGAKTTKMHQGHRGANHPVKRLEDGVVEITSMNHGFAVDNTALPDNVEETHVSLFDGSNCGIAIKGKKAFGVQYHPEASPGPMDSFYLFERFVGMLTEENV
ncbi:glutamine-hydrolyzing carbamoyl-phosphate synthase small subunit [Novosphingobium sp.]|jgi:carbamoyl-phosphate synthase small subunit|uniref:glutamine-hydrolyzing carbamoyl-phosphate synthase small subunit n=1 Tax=Novosphingobium sp. TaxID=1874826 RepID=UPI0022C98509|nr:glutamine-hydrolyzing carbamoyl-phosphate synthase small subunit [Novosphingobium sp.]MCZ8019738.1 glutamine-hydrolyzing carbamoyl-phosphate synthase small subunit [Novosphingobium sp.]MCZ8035553.1 glutamine-hydrolyzing carbamoyl-phosphate synthase small subunit [Novosphingobium sp.]MCZ8050867.1 glutamine-hydrolyzing carbamoyl-phosphate synthase small subunit [Novosphingobium sp.]MCZ8059213.1 glutamine-hydrolyzing carbamoyl-phosphate synthase small subunit [Novosphingobium sp.]MCZ8232659.1 